MFLIKEAQPPLKGITVIDVSRVLAGPFASMMLGDLGADIIKVERPHGGDQTRAWGPPNIGGESAYYLSINRNKRSITLNLKTQEGKEILKNLVEKSDVLIENFRPGSMDSFGLGFDSLIEINPGLIYCSITGYGQTGPWKNRPAYDIILQGEGGLMSITGTEDGAPVRIGVALVDMITALYTVQAIMAALLAKGKDGRGQRLDLSMFDCEVSTLTYMAANYFVTGDSPQRIGSKHPTIVPYQTFKTKDDYLVLGVGSQEIWKRFCEALKLEEILDDTRFKDNPSRVKNREALEDILSPIFQEKMTQEWVELLADNHVPVTGINNMETVFNSEQVAVREMLQTITHPTAGELKMIGIPLKFQHTPGSIERHPPLLGEHTDEILQQLGHNIQEIQQLREMNVV